MEGRGDSPPPEFNRERTARRPELLSAKRGDVPEGLGSRGRHQCARQDTAISGLALALAGTAPGDGAVRLLSLRAPAGEDAHGEAALLRPNANRGYSEMRRREGKREVPEWGGGVTFCCRNQGRRGG